MNHKNAFIVSLGLLVLLSACSERFSETKTSNIDRTFSTAKSKEASTATPPAAVTDALLPKLNDTVLNDSQSSLAQIRPSNTFNISVHEVDAREFFMSLVVDSHENMVVHPDVHGHISLELKNVNVPQVLETVKKVYGYDYAKTDIGYLIYPATLQTKIFKIDRLDMLREGSSNMRVSSGQMVGGGNNNRNNGSSSGGGGSPGYNTSPGSLGQGQGAGQGGVAGGNVGSWIMTSSKTDFWDELEKSLSAIVDVQPSQSNSNQSGELQNAQTGSKVVINKQTGMVVVRANPTQMREVEQLITSTQNQIGRQVVIEAKILEVILDDNHQNGINWANVVRKGEDALISMVAPPKAFTTAAEVFSIGVNSGDFYAFIQLLEGQGKTNILSSPRVSTLNNQKAVIKVGKDEYFITDVSSSNTVAAGGTNTPTQDITWTPFFSGVALDVTPQIADGNHVTLHIHPSVTRVEVDEKNFTINGQAGSLPLAKNEVRESDSVVHAENNQIIVIGGLMQNEFEEDKTGVSLLTEIPYLGNAFRENKGRGRKSELVILLKPTIIKNDGDWREVIDGSHQRFQELDRKPMWK